MVKKLTSADILRRYMEEELPDFAGINLVDVNQKGHFGNTPLDAAAVGGKLEEVEALLDGGADPNIQCEHGCTPLYDAVGQGHADVVRMLLRRGANPEIRSDFGDTPRERAVKKGLTKIVELFNAE